MKAGWLSPHSLRGRLSRGLALQAALGLGAVCAAVYIVIAWTLSLRQDEVLAQKQAAIQHVLREGRSAHDARFAQHLLADLLTGHGELSLRVVDGEGRPLYEDPGRPTPAGTATAAAKRLDFDIARPEFPGGRAQATLALDTASDDALLARLGWTLALAALLGTGAIAAGGVWLVGRGLAPLGQLVDQTRQVSALRLDRRLDGSGQALELQPLIAQFNALLDGLAGAYGQMESFNADVAHELNTPLATLISSCELALRRPRGREELCEVLASNLEELHRMAGIVGDMLFLSNAERGVPARRTHQDSLARLAQEVIEFHEAALSEAGLAAEVQATRRPAWMRPCCGAPCPTCWAMRRATAFRDRPSPCRSGRSRMAASSWRCRTRARPSAPSICPDSSTASTEPTRPGPTRTATTGWGWPSWPASRACMAAAPSRNPTRASPAWDCDCRNARWKGPWHLHRRLPQPGRAAHERSGPFPPSRPLCTPQSGHAPLPHHSRHRLPAELLSVVVRRHP